MNSVNLLIQPWQAVRTAAFSPFTIRWRKPPAEQPIKLELQKKMNSQRLSASLVPPPRPTSTTARPATYATPLPARSWRRGRPGPPHGPSTPTNPICRTTRPKANPKRRSASAGRRRIDLRIIIRCWRKLTPAHSFFISTIRILRRFKQIYQFSCACRTSSGVKTVPARGASTMVKR